MRRAKQSGFTLIEILLVVAIMGVLTAITIPTFVRSMKGNKLRTGARTVLMAGKYARTIALLKQQEMAVVFDLTGGSVSVHPSSTIFGGQDGDDSDGNTIKLVNSLTNTDLSAEGTNTSDEASAKATAAAAELMRKLDDVTIEYVELSRGSRRTKGSCVILYRSNGTCHPYEVRVMDDRGAGITIKVDALASAKAEHS